jgi:peptide/nickel transport system substrate-binding protein
MGNFDAQMNWQMCFSVNEPWGSHEHCFNTSWLAGGRTRQRAMQWRWSGEKPLKPTAQIVDEMGTLPLGDPQVTSSSTRRMRFGMEELPVIPITQAKKIIPFDTTYWTGWPTYDNQYIHPPTWWQQFHVICRT